MVDLIRDTCKLHSCNSEFSVEIQRVESTSVAMFLITLVCYTSVNGCNFCSFCYLEEKQISSSDRVWQSGIMLAQTEIRNADYIDVVGCNFEAYENIRLLTRTFNFRSQKAQLSIHSKLNQQVVSHLENNLSRVTLRFSFCKNSRLIIEVLSQQLLVAEPSLIMINLSTDFRSESISCRFLW